MKLKGGYKFSVSSPPTPPTPPRQQQRRNNLLLPFHRGSSRDLLSSPGLGRKRFFVAAPPPFVESFTLIGSFSAATAGLSSTTPRHTVTLHPKKPPNTSNLFLISCSIIPSVRAPRLRALRGLSGVVERVQGGSNKPSGAATTATTNRRVGAPKLANLLVTKTDVKTATN